MSTSSKKQMMTPGEVEEIYGIPRGTLANMRWQKKGPKYYKPTPRRVLYMACDVIDWISRNPIQTIDSIPSKGFEK